MDLSGISLKNVGYNDLQQINKLEKETEKVEKFSSQLDKAMEEKDEKQLKKACVEFESYFLNMMFKSMRKTVVPGMEKSNAQQMFEEMLDQQMCQNIAEGGGIGFSDMMYNQLSKNI